MAEVSLRRYTDISSLIYLLHEKAITLLDPASWDDRNDSYYLELYAKKKELHRILALCFCESNETYHHWRVFANGVNGVCIQFHKEKLLRAITRHKPGVRAQPVKYCTIDDIRLKANEREDLPFFKRIAFEAEREFRLVYPAEVTDQRTLDIRIPLTAISRINLSPWIPKDLSKHVKDLLKSISGCANISIFRSTLVENERWKKLGKYAANLDRPENHR